MIAPGFESHQCLTGMWKRRLSCHVGHQEVSRCCTRGESQGMCNVTCMPLLSSNKAEPTLALKPRGDITRSPKKGYQWPHKKDSCPPKILKKIPLNQVKMKAIQTEDAKYCQSWYQRQILFPWMCNLDWYTNWQTISGSLRLPLNDTLFCGITLTLS